MNNQGPLVGEIHAPDSKVVVADYIANLTLADGRTESRLFAGVPPRPPIFVGRDELVAELRGRIKDGGVLALEGAAGVGKTTLAAALAWDAEVLAHFSGGVLWTSLGPSPNTEELLNRWAEAFGIDVTQEPSIEQRAARIQAKLTGRSFLFVLDDAWREHPPDLLCRITAPGCAHLLTTRDQVIASRLASGNPESIEELPEEQAVALLTTLCPIAAQADEEALRRMARAVGGLPLALTLIGGYLADQITFRAEVAQVFQALEGAEAWLGLKDRERRLKLSEVIDLSIDALPDDAARQVFTHLAAFAPKPASFSLKVAQAVSGGGLAVLGTLVRRFLLEKMTEERVAIHPVVAACAQRRAHLDGHLADLQAQHADLYLDWVNQDRSDWRRIETEWPQIQQGWRWVVTNQDDWTIEYTMALGRFLELRGLWRTAFSWNKLALAAACRLKQRDTEAVLLNNIGRVYDNLGERGLALEFYEKALPVCREVGDQACEAATLNNIGAVYNNLGERWLALEFCEKALQICREVGDPAGEATTLNNIGLFYDNLGDRRQALKFFKEALPIRRKVGDRAGEATTLNNIGLVYDKLGDRRRALEFYELALPIRRKVGDRAGEATTLNNIGAVYINLSKRRRALKFFKKALPIWFEVGNREGEAATLFNIGKVYETEGNLEQAAQLLEQAVTIAEAIAHPDLESHRASLNALRHKLRGGWLRQLFRFGK
ncbi:MAG: tetratricopeptide repeat protein [Limisphaerales bacterium]